MKRMSRKWMISLLIATILITGLAGCAKRSENVRFDSDGYGSNKTKSVAPEEMRGVEQENVYDEQGSSYADIKTDRKIIQTKYYVIETLEFDKTVPVVEKLVNEHSGYLESSQVSGRTLYENYYSNRTAYYTMRIPAERLNQFSEKLEAIGNVIDKSTSKEDVTTQLVDVEARIKTLEVQETRLIELLKTGGDLKDILEIEKQLSDVRYEIESYKATMKSLESQVSYSTVQLELREVVKVTDQVKPAKTVGQRISQGFIRTLENIKEFFVDLFVLIIIVLPYLIIWALFIGIIIIIIKKLLRKNKVNKKNKMHNGEREEFDEENSSVESKDKNN